MKKNWCAIVVLMVLACSPKPENSRLNDNQIVIQSDQTYFSDSMFDSIPESVKTVFNPIKYAEPVCSSPSSCRIGLPDGSSFSLGEMQSYFNTFDGTIRITSYSESAPTTYPENSAFYPGWGSSYSDDSSSSSALPDRAGSSSTDLGHGGGDPPLILEGNKDPLNEDISALIATEMKRSLSYLDQAISWKSDPPIGMLDQRSYAPTAPLDFQEIGASFKAYFDAQEANLDAAISENSSRTQNEVATALALVLNVENQSFDRYNKIREEFKASSQTLLQDATVSIQNANFQQADSKLEELAANIKQSQLDRSVLAQNVSAKLPSVEIAVRPAPFKTDSVSLEGRAVRRASTYIDFGNRIISDPAHSGEGRKAADQLMMNARETLVLADSAYANENSAAGEVGLHLVYSLVDAAISIAPLVVMITAPELIAVPMALALAKDWYEARTGMELLTGDPLSGFQRSMATIGVAAAIVVGPVASVAKGTAELSKAVGLTEELIVAGKNIDEVLEIKEVSKISGRVLDSAREVSSQLSKTVNFKIAPRVAEQLADPRLGNLAGKLDEALLNQLLNEPTARRFLDANSGHINIIQQVEDKLLRITVTRDEFKIISVGPIRANGLTNGIENARFIPLN